MLRFALDRDGGAEPEAPVPDRGLNLKTPAEGLPSPANEWVARRLAKTDPKRRRQIWRETVERHGPGATVADVEAVANERPPEADWEAGLRALVADLRRVCKRKDPKDAKRALARWRGSAYAVLDRIARADQ